MQGTYTDSLRGFLATLLIYFLLLGLCSTALAGTGLNDEGEAEAEVTRIEVNLHGVNRFGAVQLFDYLLGKTTGIITSRKVSIRLVEDNPEKCQAGWSLRTAGRHVDDVQQEMMALIQDLNPEGQNEILYEAPFIVMKEDLEIVKQLIPFEAVPGYLAFGVEYRVSEDIYEPAPLKIRELNQPWYMQDDKGFE